MNCIVKSEVLNTLNTLKLTDPDSISNIDKVLNVINNIPGEEFEHVIHCRECEHFLHFDDFVVVNNKRLKAGRCFLENSIYNTFDDDDCILHIETDFCNKGEYKENDA